MFTIVSPGISGNVNDESNENSKLNSTDDEKNRQDAADDDDEAASIGGSSEMDDIVGVTIQRLVDCPDELGRTGLALASMKGYETMPLIDHSNLRYWHSKPWVMMIYGYVSGG